MGAALKKRIKQEHFRSDFSEAMLSLLVTADFLRNEMEAICSRSGLTTAQYNVLRILRSIYPEGYPRSEIIDRMIERAPDVTRLVDRLAAARLVVRDRSARDRRLSLTRITKKGIDLLNTIKPDLDALEDHFAAMISREDCMHLSRICETIYDQE